MQIDEFALERLQSLYENTVEINLSDSGVHPYTLQELLTPQEVEGLLRVELGYGQTNGSLALRQAIAQHYAARTPDEVIVTNGSAEANFLLAMTLLEAGDELVVLVPNYMQIAGWAKALGVVVRQVSLRADLGWAPDLEELARAITPRTKMVTLCHPNNPTGSVLERSTMDAIVALARRHDLYLHADEVYKGVELAGPESVSFADLYDKAIVTSGLSKAMALPGLRLGWLVGPAKAIYGAWQRKDYTSITASAVSEYIGTLVLEPARRQAVLARSKRILRDNGALLAAWIAANADYFSYVPPKATGMAFVRYHFPMNSTDLVHRLRTTASTLLLPGDVYGLDGYVRIGIGAPAAHLQTGLTRLSEFARAQER